MNDDGDLLRPIGRWDPLWRGSFFTIYDGAEYVIDVDFFDFKERIRLYRDGKQIDVHKSPARFEIGSGIQIEAAMSLYGMKYVDVVRTGEARREPLHPRKGTGEAWRADLARKHPRTHRSISAVSWSILVFAAITQVPVLFNAVLGGLTGVQLPTLDLPIWANTTLGVAGIVAAIDRALQVKYNKWIDE